MRCCGVVAVLLTGPAHRIVTGEPAAGDGGDRNSGRGNSRAMSSDVPVKVLVSSSVELEPSPHEHHDQSALVSTTHVSVVTHSYQ